MFFTRQKEPEVPQVTIKPTINIDEIQANYEVLKDGIEVKYNQDENNFEVLECRTVNDTEDIRNNDIDDVNEDVNEDDNVDDEDEVDDEVDDEEEDEEEDDMKEGDDYIFVTAIDNIPYFHNKSLEVSRQFIDKLSKKYIIKETESDNLHNTYIRYKSLNEIDIIHNFDLIFFSYNYIAHSIKIHRTINKF